MNLPKMTLKLYEKFTYNEINPYVKYYICTQVIHSMYRDFFFRELKFDLQYGLWKLLKENDDISKRD